MSLESPGDSVPALVLGSGLNGLGVARSLGTMGIPVYLADTDMRRSELRTRYATPLKLSAMHGQELLDDLVACAEMRFAGQRPVLVLTQEQSVRTVAMAQEMLRPLFRFLLPSGELLETLMHKEGFDRLAAQTGLRVPRTVHVMGRGDIDAALALIFPLIVKPALHSPVYELAAFRKAYLVNEVDEAHQLLEQILAVLPDVVVQEWVPGNDSDIYFCLQQMSSEGRLESSFVGHKIRSWPPNVGGTASCTSAVEYAANLTEITAGFFSQVGMCGLASMEYKRHAVTGEFVAIEPTVGRTDYQEEVATLNGVNLPYAYYCSAIDEKDGMHRTQDTKRNLVWRDRSADEQSLAHPDQVVRNWPQGCGEICDALWRSEDPRPWVAAQWLRVARKSKRLFNRFTPERNTK